MRGARPAPASARKCGWPLGRYAIGSQEHYLSRRRSIRLADADQRYSVTVAENRRTGKWDWRVLDRDIGEIIGSGSEFSKEEAWQCVRSAKAEQERKNP